MEEIIEQNLHLNDKEFGELIEGSLTPEMEQKILDNLKTKDYEKTI